MKYLLLCIGNRDGGDDSVGPYIADILKKEKSKDISVIDSGIIPENYTGTIKKIEPEKLVIIDAVDMDLKPGEIRIVPKEKIGVMHVSTHGIPISVLVKYLDQYVKEIFIIGIQPKVMSGKMTEIVKKSSKELIEIIKKDEIQKIKKL